MNKIKVLTLSLLVSATFAGSYAAAVETVGEKMETSGNKAADSVKKGMHKGEDKACEMVNGKMSCAGKKMKHKMQDAAGSASTKGTEVKNKIDK